MYRYIKVKRALGVKRALSQKWSQHILLDIVLDGFSRGEITHIILQYLSDFTVSNASFPFLSTLLIFLSDGQI